MKLRAKQFPFLVVFPQCEDVGGRALTGWLADSPDGKRALRILNEMENEYSVDSKRRILTGWSMGGYGTWSIAAAHPEHWAAVVPVAGGGDVQAARALKNVPVWAFHGEDDRAILPKESQEMVKAIQAAGGRPRLTEIPQVGHDVWKNVYDAGVLIDWMLDPNQRKTASVAAFRGNPERLKQFEAEFIPAVEIPRAIYVRIGNRALKSASYSIPAIVPADALSGRIEDMTDTTVSEGRTFNVYFSRIFYQAKLSRAYVQASQSQVSAASQRNRVTIQLGLSHVTLTIGRTDVVGKHRSAVAGPIDVVLGHRRPVWLNLHVVPYVQARKLRLKLVGRSFDIPDDNWYVTRPAGVSTKGLGMTAEKVSSGLVNGLYASKGRIEREFLNVVPSLVKQIEEKLQLEEVSGLVRSFWPLPVYHPRIRVWPEEISVDTNGISLSLGVTAAAVNPETAPKSPRRYEPLGPSLDTLPRGNDLQIGFAPNIVKPLTELLIEENLARIHVLDIPDNAFQEFVNRKALEEAIPDLKNFPDQLEIRSELILRSPLSVRDHHSRKKPETIRDDDSSSIDAPKPGSAPSTNLADKLNFVLPKVTIAISVRTDANQSNWTQYVECDFSIVQSASVHKTSPDFQTRGVRIDWDLQAEITPSARFVSTYKPKNPKIDVEKILELFSSSWQAWTAGGPVAEAEVPDLNLGYSKLRLKEIRWSAPHLLLAKFAEPGVRITNSSAQQLVYETKGPHSKWGDPITLPPGEFHEFEIAYPLLYRRKLGSSYRMFTLPVGSHSEFRVPKSGGAPQLFEARHKVVLDSQRHRNQ
ncbi:MAG: prolyl oligopeptidase family serine peptidase [Planctomycetes bacterium]|nr:prolyl oligopeptidase family serine peptidase [Planctomycetota bacterium]